MKQPWLNNPKTDSVFILMPQFLVLSIVFFFQDFLKEAEENHSFFTWLLLIVFIDVAHVYATLFKTYFVKDEFQKKRKLLIFLPIICFAIGFVLFLFGAKIFWSVLAYVAVFHFIRQQYGFMRLYSRNEIKTKQNIFFDNLFIYTATVYPMVFWFMSSPRQFTWFVENEFVTYQNPELLQVFTWIYYLILGFYIARTAYFSTREKYFNIPKNVIIIGTFLSWYFGIVYFNNDLIFTLLNVVSHGIPYMALIYFNQKESRHSFKIPKLSSLIGIVAYVGILLFFAFSEEYLWEILVWNEHFNFSESLEYLVQWQIILVPLLTVPQFTHYVLDGFIWKSKK